MQDENLQRVQAELAESENKFGDWLKNRLNALMDNWSSGLDKQTSYFSRCDINSSRFGWRD
jgi:hypothetical protein